MRLAVLAALLLLCAAGAQAKVYKWTDAQGRVHYSANPPPGAEAREVRIAPPPPSAAQPAQAEPVSGSTSDEPAVKTTKRNDASRKNCETARQNLAILENPAIRRFREDGKEPVYYTDEQRQARIEQARQMVDTFCKDAQP